jgi:hypothetical protein
VTDPRPTLDYSPRLVEANRQYRVTAPPVDLSKQAVWWSGGVVLDQGQEGSCVGHGVVGEWLASPVRGRLGNYTTVGAQIAGHQLAVAVYDAARKVDEFEGDDTEGTSVRAGLLVGRQRGWYGGFNWAFNMRDLRAALQAGPVVIGVEWHQDSYDTQPNGDLRVTGPVVGGHCILVTGYSPNYNGRGPRYRLRNSWGAWGLRGSGDGYVSPDDLNRILFAAGGEAAIPSGRHL